MRFFGIRVKNPRWISRIPGESSGKQEFVSILPKRHGICDNHRKFANQPTPPTMNNKPIYAISSSENQINRILLDLCGAGASSCDICVLPPRRNTKGQVVTGRATVDPGLAIAGAILGGLVASVLGLLLGLDSSTIPTLLSVIAAGAGLGALATALPAISSAGNTLRKSMRMWNPSLEAESFQDLVPEGNYLISIRATDRRDEFRVRRILSEVGVENLPSR